jgi:hypothetical protein
MTSAERVRRWREQHGVTKQEAVARALEQKVAEQAAEIERLRLKAGPEIDPQTLSMTAQQKLDVAIRQEKRRLAAQYDHDVQKGIRETVEATVMPRHLEQMDNARQVIESRKGIMKRETYRLILACLHPDQSASKERLSKAFRVFSDLELVFLSEKEMPTTAARVPRTAEEWMRAREQAQGQRRAQRSAGKMQRKS